MSGDVFKRDYCIMKITMATLRPGITEPKQSSADILLKNNLEISRCDEIESDKGFHSKHVNLWTMFSLGHDIFIIEFKNFQQFHP